MYTSEASTYRWNPALSYSQLHPLGEYSVASRLTGQMLHLVANGDEAVDKSRCCIDPGSFMSWAREETAVWKWVVTW